LARKSYSTATASSTLAQVKDRRDRAISESRFMQGLDFAKQVYKAEPNADNRAVLFNAYIGRAAELRRQNKLRDAVTTLQNAVGLVDADPGRLTVLGQELSACGEARQALLLLQQIPDSLARQEVLIRAADAAVRQEAQGRSTLPEEMWADFDRVMQAFAQLDAGQDEAARETLQAIGLRSPFAEWKLFLRGLQAYYTKDDARAIENWQRLDAERLPARLAAPLRALIDPAYCRAQPPASQNLLQKQLDRLQDQGLSPFLRQIQAALATDNRLAEAFRVVDTLLPTLRQQAPDLVPRLAMCFYWANINVGTPDHVPRYLKAFGPPPDDPNCQRMGALACERCHDFEEAHKFWQEYAESIAKDALHWPGETGKGARALIWLHMGKNAASVPNLDSIPHLPDFLRNHPDRPKPLNPSAEKCFRQSIDLAPDLLPAHESLVEYHKNRQEYAKAEKAARHLLLRFPDHGHINQELADLLMKVGKYAEALECYQCALAHHPLDRTLRKQVGTAHLFHARSLAEFSRFEEARAEYRAALEVDPAYESSVLCKWATCEFKAGDSARGEELLGQAAARCGSRLGTALAMLIEANRLKLSKPLKSRFDREFKEALAAEPTPTDVVEGITVSAVHRAADFKYTGQKGHEKDLLAFVAKVPRTAFTEDQLVRVCEAMLTLQAVRPLRSLCKWAARRFRHCAMFPFLEAESYFIKGMPTPTGFSEARHLLETAQFHASAMPPNQARTELEERIRTRLKGLELLHGGGPMRFLQNILDGCDPDDFEDDEMW
jgi:tetratricopeptide (TPR) repeat protein